MGQSVKPLMLTCLLALSAVAARAQFQEPNGIDQEMSDLLGNLPEARRAITFEPPRASPEPLPAPGIPAHPQDLGLPTDDARLQNAVAAFASRFWSGRVDQLESALWRIGRIRPELERTLTEEGVPPRFAAVVLVESGANALALSPKDARGLWQIVPGTARRYGLTVNEHQDDRVDLLKSTRAAARYLRDLYQTFGNWQLALAAYNEGEAALREAIQRAHSFNFQLLSDRELIPTETRSYVPAVLAAVDLLNLETPSSAGEVRPYVW